MIYQDSLDIPSFMLHSDEQEVIILRDDSEGVFLRKGDVDPCFPLSPEKARDITFTESTCLVYFLREELELTPSKKY